MSYEFAGIQDIGAREEQQDAFAFSSGRGAAAPKNEALLCVIADGVGGLEDGALAAKTAVDTFMAAYERKVRDEPVLSALHRSALEAHRAVTGVASRTGRPGGAGATLVVAALYGMRLYWISAGDSRAYLVRDSRLHQLTTDHNMGTMMDDEGGESPGQDGRREVLTSCLGKPGDVILDASYTPLTLKTGDGVLVCTDGLYRTLSESGIAGLTAYSPKTSCAALVRAVRDQHVEEQDNVTVALIKLATASTDNPWPAKIAIGLLILFDAALTAVLCALHGLFGPAFHWFWQGKV